jgi:hypothetical protein
MDSLPYQSDSELRNETLEMDNRSIDPEIAFLHLYAAAQVLASRETA